MPPFGNDLDELDRVLGTASDAPDAPQAERPARTTAPAEIDKRSPYFDPCKKCGGSGYFYGRGVMPLGPCYTCKGKGGAMRTTTREQRAKDAQQRQSRAQSKAEERLGAFAEEFPAEAAWVEQRRERFDFAQSMHEAVVKWGVLTDNQMAAVRRCMVKDAERDQARAKSNAEREANAPRVDTSAIEEAFGKATDAGLKKPRLRFEGFTAKLAPANGRNAGAIYVTAPGDDYLGKIAGGKFYRSRDCGDEAEAMIVATMADPLAAAVAYGRKTGVCSCCGRELTDPVSVERGIGPICESKYGF